jgi:hypothetical protein
MCIFSNLLTHFIFLKMFPKAFIISAGFLFLILSEIKYLELLSIQKILMKSSPLDFPKNRSTLNTVICKVFAKNAITKLNNDPWAYILINNSNNYLKLVRNSVVEKNFTNILSLDMFLFLFFLRAPLYLDKNKFEEKKSLTSWFENFPL